MRSRRTVIAARVAALVAVALVVPVAAAGTTAAQEHPHPTTTTTHGEHPHPTTPTTTPGPTTTPPPTTPPTTTPTTTAPQPPGPGEPRTTTLRYGPYAQEAAVPNPDGSHGHWHSGNQFAFGVEKPCTDCFITGMQADLVHPDGTRAGYSTGSQLHHMVLFNQDEGKIDATCHDGIPFPLGSIFGQRFFASGDERTHVTFPDGYGYHVGAEANWNLIWDLAGMSREPKTVYYQVTYEWVPAPAGLENVEPIWFDVAQCGFSTFRVEPGPSTRSWTWNVNRPGDIVAVGGHGHDGTVNIDVRNDTTGELICDSRAGYGEDPLYIDPEHGDAHLSSMSTCIDTPVAQVAEGQQVTINAHYEMAKADDGQMAIVMAYVGAPLPEPEPACVTAGNWAHAKERRAWAFLFWAFARGSNDYLGKLWGSSALREGPSGTWEKVAGC